EFNETDNTAFQVIDVQTLPDLTLSSGQILWDPQFPHENEPINFNITISNMGDQPANNVLVELLENGSLAGSQTIASIVGHSTGSTIVQWSPSGITGEVPITVRVNSGHTINEVRYDNNEASVNIAIQNGDIYVNNRYFSPNGDGSQDTTTV